MGIDCVSTRVLPDSAGHNPGCRERTKGKVGCDEDSREQHVWKDLLRKNRSSSVQEYEYQQCLGIYVEDQLVIHPDSLPNQPGRDHVAAIIGKIFLSSDSRLPSRTTLRVRLVRCSVL